MACDLHQPKFVAIKLKGNQWNTHRPSLLPELQACDKRTPALFKVQFHVEGIVALCIGQQRHKLSCKSLNKTLKILTKASYIQVLQTQTVAVDLKEESQQMARRSIPTSNTETPTLE